jgi:hypothetical protein
MSFSDREIFVAASILQAMAEEEQLCVVKSVGGSRPCHHAYLIVIGFCMMGTSPEITLVIHLPTQITCFDVLLVSHMIFTITYAMSWCRMTVTLFNVKIVFTNLDSLQIKKCLQLYTSYQLDTVPMHVMSTWGLQREQQWNQ